MHRRSVVTYICHLGGRLTGDGDGGWLGGRWQHIFPGAADTTPGGGRMTDDGDDGRTGAGGWVVQITTVAYPPNSHSSALDHFKPCSHVVMPMEVFE